MSESKRRPEVRVVTASEAGPSAEGLSVERLRTIIQDSHLNFLIGAGTSASYFEPLGPIEDVLTQLGRGTQEARLARASVQAFFFLKVLVPNAQLLAHNEKAKTLITSYAKFVAILNRILLKRRSSILGKQVSVFTTNVDMAIEVALELLEIDYNDGFSGKIQPRLDLGSFGTLRFRQGTRFEYRSEIPVVNLVKIHGSAGWRQQGEEIFFDHKLQQIREVAAKYKLAKDQFVKIDATTGLNSLGLIDAAQGHALNKEGQDFVDAYESLSIVNPEKTKFATTVMNKTYYELLRRLANELERENSVLMVHGFSFRDEHLLDLVLRSAATNPTLQVIVFCYNRKAFAEISQFFPVEKIKNGNVLLVQPASPGDGEEERSLSLDVVVEDYLNPILLERAPSADTIIELKLSTAAEAADV